MSKITLDELHEILHKPEDLCNGFDLHIRHCWKKNKSKSLFYLTGIDLSSMLGKEIEETIKIPSCQTIIIPPVV